MNSLFPETHEILIQRDWQDYADACLTHDHDVAVVDHARELADSAGGWLVSSAA